MGTRRWSAVTAVSLVLTAPVLSACGSSESTAQPVGEVVRYEADYPTYTSSAELVGATDVIVRGTVQASRVEELLPEIVTEGDPVANPQSGLSPQEAAEVQPVVVTVSTVKVSEVIKGDVAVGDTVEVSQLGGQLAGKNYVESGTTLLQRATDTEYVLMLADFGSDVPMDLVNPAQGLFVVADGTALEQVRGEQALGLKSIEGLKAAVAEQQ